MRKGKKRNALETVHPAPSVNTGNGKTRRTRAEKQAATLNSLLSAEAVVLLSDSEGEKENSQGLNGVSPKTGAQDEKQERSIVLSDDEDIMPTNSSKVLGNASAPENSETPHCAGNENIEETGPADEDMNVGTEGRLEGEVIQMRDERDCPQSGPGTLLDAAMVIDSAVDAGCPIGEESRTDPGIESTEPDPQPCIQTNSSSHEKEGATAGSSREAIAKAEPTSAVAPKSEVVYTKNESDIGSNLPSTMDDDEALDDDEDDDDDDELEPLYAYRPPTLPPPTLLVLEDDNSCDLPCQPSDVQAAEKPAPGVELPQNKVADGKPVGNVAAAVEERWSLGDVLGTLDVLREAERRRVELCTNESAALIESRQMAAEKARMEEERKVEMELKGIEEAASRATQARHVMALEASKEASKASLRQSSGVPKGGACDPARECGVKGGGEGSEEGEEGVGGRSGGGGGGGEGGGEGEETAAVAKVMVKMSIREADGMIVEKMYNMKKSEPFQKLFDAFAKTRGHVSSQYRFTFEDRIDPRSTPASLDMEDDDMVEATFLR